MWLEWSWVNSMIAGAGGGFVSSVATCPLDVIKTKLQAQRASSGHPTYEGVVDTAKSILKHEGIRGMYRGLGPTLLGYLPTWAIYFAVYDGVKTHFGETPLGGVKARDRIYPAAQFLSAVTAGATSTICTNPLWVIKTRFMTQSRDEIRYRHTLDAAWTIYRSEGIRAFYRGLVPSLLGIAHVAVQFPLYEHLRDWTQRETNLGDEYRRFLCSAVSKMTASVATYPHEVIRTRLQTQRRPLADDASSDGMVKSHLRRGIVYTTRKIIIKEGWTALYKGLSINLIRTVPNSVITIATYEHLFKRFEERI